MPFSPLEASKLPSAFRLGHCNLCNLILDGSLRCANSLCVVNELVSELAKELVAACHLVICMDHLLEKR